MPRPAADQIETIAQAIDTLLVKEAANDAEIGRRLHALKPLITHGKARHGTAWTDFVIKRFKMTINRAGRYMRTATAVDGENYHLISHLNLPNSTLAIVGDSPRPIIEAIAKAGEDAAAAGKKLEGKHVNALIPIARQARAHDSTISERDAQELLEGAAEQAIWLKKYSRVYTWRADPVGGWHIAPRPHLIVRAPARATAPAIIREHAEPTAA